MIFRLFFPDPGNFFTHFTADIGRIEFLLFQAEEVAGGYAEVVGKGVKRGSVWDGPAFPFSPSGATYIAINTCLGSGYAFFLTQFQKIVIKHKTTSHYLVDTEKATKVA